MVAPPHVTIPSPPLPRPHAYATNRSVCMFILAVGRLPFYEKHCPPPPPPDVPTPQLPALAEFQSLSHAQAGGRDGVDALCQRKGIDVEWRRLDRKFRSNIEKLLHAHEPSTRRAALGDLKSSLAASAVQPDGDGSVPTRVSGLLHEPASLDSSYDKMEDEDEDEYGVMVMHVGEAEDHEPCSPPVFRGARPRSFSSPSAAANALHDDQLGEDEGADITNARMRCSGQMALTQPTETPRRLQRRWGAAA